MSFLEHLDELRKRLIACVYALVVGCAVAFFFISRISDFVWLPLYHDAPNASGAKLMYTAGSSRSCCTMKIGVLAGLIIASPFIL